RTYRVVGVEEAQSLRVSPPDHLYVTSNFTLTHNTLTAVEVVRERDPRTVVVVCPLGTRVGWEQTFERQGLDLPVRRVASTTRGKEALASLLADEAGVYLIGREYVRRLPPRRCDPTCASWTRFTSCRTRILSRSRR